MPKKSAGRRPERKPKQNLLLPILSITTIVTAIIGYLLYRSLITPIQIAGISEPCPTGFDCTLPKPTNLNFKCNSDNTKMTLSWDDTSPGKYSFGFNNQDNDIPTNWHIANSEDVWRGGDLDTNTIEVSVTKNKTYHWWVNSNVAGPSSNKSLTTSSTAYCGDPIPEPKNLKVTCSSDNTKAILSWDDVSPGKYNFAFNDPSNDTPNSWFIANTEDVWRGGDLDINQVEVSINPNKEYRWSVESNLNGPSTPKSTTARSTVHCEPKPPAPANPKLICSPDGKSVKFSWDSVNSVESYKIRLDNKKGNVTNYDNIRETQKIVEIYPNQPYSYWMHSHQGGYDSNQTTAVDFTCTPTATPSTPTPKPSIQPTPTPTPITYAIPSPKVLFDNTPSTHPTANLADDTNPQNDSDYSPTPTPTTSTQKPSLLTRFIQWISDLLQQ